MASTGEVWKLGHRPALDGVRGIAVLIVVADHAGYLPMSSGSIGVTMFFALSGFLITRLIVEARQGGAWSLPRFYLNRAARLVPALLLMVGFVSAVLLVAGMSGSAVAARAVPAVLYVQNYMPRLPYAIFQHTWSLAVEEQFYLLWPLALPLLLRAHRPLRWLGGAIVASASLWIAVDTGALPMHVYGLLAGGALALSADRLPAPPRHAGLAAGIGLAASTLAAGILSDDSPYPRLLSVPFALALVWSALDGSRLLESRPLVFTGRISYAVYLWHFPLIGLSTFERGSLVLVPVIALSFAVATVSTLWVEEPIRRAWRLRGAAELDSEGCQENVQRATRVLVAD